MGVPVKVDGKGVFHQRVPHEGRAHFGIERVRNKAVAPPAWFARLGRR